MGARADLTRFILTSKIFNSPFLLRKSDFLAKIIHILKLKVQKSKLLYLKYVYNVISLFFSFLVVLFKSSDSTIPFFKSFQNFLKVDFMYFKPLSFSSKLYTVNNELSRCSSTPTKGCSFWSNFKCILLIVIFFINKIIMLT